MKKIYSTTFPKHLKLWMEGEILKYKAEENELSSSKLSFLKANSDFFKGLLNNYKSKSISVLPLAHNQKALLFLHEVDPQNFSYNISLAAELRDPINTDALTNALSYLIDEHQMLRTVFSVLPGGENEACQIVLEKTDPFIEQIDGSHLGKDEIRDLLTKKNRIPFDLEHGPLIRTFVVNASGFSVLNFNLHHIICDAISLRNFLDEFILLYDSFIDNEKVETNSPQSDYGDFIFEQISFLNSKKGEDQINYWAEKIEGKPHILNIPLKNERPSIHQFKGSTLLFRIGGDRYEDLRMISRENGVSFNVLLMSAFEFFISRISMQGNFFVGLPVSGRTSRETEKTFGYFINLLPVSCSVSAGQTFKDLLNDNKSHYYESLDNQAVPFPVIVERVSPRRDLSRTPVFQVIFNYLSRNSLGPLLNFIVDNETAGYSSWGTLSVKPFKISDQEGQVDLTLEIADDDTNLYCALKYNTDIFDTESAVNFRNEFLNITDQIVRDLTVKADWLPEPEKEKTVKPVLTINITGTFTTEPVKPYLEFWFSKMGLNPEIVFPGYNQLFTQLLNPVSEFNLNKDGYNILLIRLEDWIREKNSEVPGDEFAGNIEELENAFMDAFRLNPGGKYIVAFCPVSPLILKNAGMSASIAEAERKFKSSLELRSNVIFLGSAELVDTYDVQDYYEELGEETGHIPYSDEFFISLSTIIARKIHVSFRAPFKAIAVDCDNTLWKGVIAEEGATGVRVGASEAMLQEFLVEQFNSGLLICLCSKNREEDVFEVFEKNREMILKREHIAFHRINWNTKSENILQLAKEINIGPDSFVFIDDNPVECAEVRNNIPEVLVIQVPQSGFTIRQLRNMWIFDKIRITDEDRKRSEKYREEAVRTSFRSSAGSYKKFIEGLNLKIEMIPFEDKNIPRISQLTYRTNQFNFTTSRKSEIEISNISADKNYDCFQVSLSDRFGDYGLTGVVIVNKSGGYKVETFLLSCRVLGKGLEHSLISFLGSKASNNNCAFLTASLKKTPKNIPAQNFLELNFSDLKKEDNGVLVYDIPVERAIGLNFDPDLSFSSQEVVEEEKGKSGSGSPETTVNNDFFYEILDKYLLLENVIAELNEIKPGNAPLVEKAAEKYGKTEKDIKYVWQKVLKSENFSSADNFFDIGGHSVLIPQVVIMLRKQFDIKIKIVDVFQYPTINDLAAYIDGQVRPLLTDNESNRRTDLSNAPGNDIAIIGMSGRFTGAADTAEYWNAISEGREAISYYTLEELESKGVDKGLLENIDYVRANGNIASADQFDSAFFGITPREADYMDPQHRVFLETCYEALENAGYTSEKYQGEIGVFAGCGMNNYLLKNLFQHHDSLRATGEFQTIINNNSDYLTTRVSYKLNLTGPSIDIQTACSTSLVAIHIAGQNLVNHNCDIALAGGVFIQIPHAEGYMYEAGGIFSRDGHCRPFDSESDGTLFGEGSGVIVMKRLEDAIRDCDSVLAVIKGSAINNDGSGKVGYMAPSVNGQAAVINKAMIAAGVSPEAISYIETHGTGTRMGDPIEVNALKHVFNRSSELRNPCFLGSVKANIGHLDAAAGVASVIKVVMMLKNRKMPPQINYNLPNPELGLTDTPFIINTSLADWVQEKGPRIAGISSFGIGGTNAHCIIEEAPEEVKIPSSQIYHMLPVTAKTPGALKNLGESITRHIKDSGQEIADISYTLQHGRTHYKHRALLIYKKDSEIVSEMSGSRNSGIQELFSPRVVFIFTGQGSQYAGMVKDLYNEFPVFKNIIDKANRFLKKNFDLEILKYILSDGEMIQDEVSQTYVAQPLLFSVQYALAMLLEKFGIKPDVLMGHSIGEYAAAVISGVFEFEEALKLVAWRGKLMQVQKPGSMLSVQLQANDLAPYISDKVNLSLKNAPDINVLSGETHDINEAYQRLSKDHPGVHLTRLKTSHAFHSYMMEPVIDPFNEILKTIKFGESKIPVISNKTGTWAEPNELSVPGYWTDQIRSTVNFADGVQKLVEEGNCFFIEVGPGNTIASLLSQYNGDGKKIKMVSTVRHPKVKADDISVFLDAVSKSWIYGVNIDWHGFYKHEKRYRVPLPPYPFERKRHWIDPVVPFNYFGAVQGEAIQNTHDAPGTKTTGDLNDEASADLHFRPSMNHEYTAPVSEVEIALEKIWEDLLGISKIGSEDDFFFLGGHSLLASRVINRISEKFGIRLPIESLFTFPTIKGLAAKIESETPSKNLKADFINLDPDGILPVSFDQKRLWIINQIDQNNPAYNIPFTYRLKGSLNTALFVRSLEILFQRQSGLRSSIRSREGKPYCIINKYKKLPVQLLDFTKYSPEIVENEIQKFFTLESRETFDIENGPLFRIYLVKITESEYIFHLTVQHMIFDGWSWGIFAGELRQIYNDLAAGREIGLKPLNFQYYDLANWQESTVHENTFTDLVGYWKEQLKDHPSEINFPYDYRRPKILSGLGSRESLRLPPELSDKLRNLSQSESSTMFMTLLAAFGLLLNKYSGDNDICIGAPTANRENSDTEEIIGLFVNTIVLRLKFGENQSFRDLLKQTRLTTLSALAHKDLPFERLVDTLQPDRKVNVNPITQIVFAYQNTPRPPLALEGIIPERILIRDTISPFDLTFFAWEENGIIEGELEYNSDLIDQDTVIRLKNNYLSLLTMIVQKPDSQVSALKFMSEEETRRIKGFSGTVSSYPKQKTIVQLFKEQVLLHKRGKALIFKNDIYTYGELDRKTDHLAATLRKAGVAANIPVAILCEKSAGMVIGILAILKAGGGYVPIDPDYPQSRIDFILADSDCKILLLQDKFMKIKVEGIEKISLDSADSYKSEISGKNTNGNSSDLGYIMYTSGTTGKPKGSVILQYSIARLVLDTNYIKITPADRILLTGAIVFDATTFEIWGALLNGASLYIVDKETILDPDAMGKELKDNRITILWLTSPLFTQLAEIRADIFSDLKYLLVGGDVLSVSHINKVKENYPELKIINGYGPTENTTFSTTFQIDKHYENSIPIGKPISNSTAYILDKNLNFQPIGVIGELFVGGDGLTQGYLKRDELNRTSFVQNPNNKGERLYRTGDNARWLPDGNIEFHGRIDKQLKIRGFRVELEEIESVISETPGIVETVVKPFETKGGDKRLAAFLNINDSYSMNNDELVRILREKLPSYMIPSGYSFFHEFPKTVNGKTDRNALKAEVNDMPESEIREVAKTTPTEKAILDIWNKSLSCDIKTVNDNFFEIGGNSLLAISVFSRIQTAFDIKLNLRMFFDSPRIKDLAEMIDVEKQKSGNKKRPVKGKVYSKIVKGQI